MPGSEYPSAGGWDDRSRLESLERWRRQGVVAGRAHTELLLQAVALREGESVLDVSCGAGEPALAEARAVGPTGRVVGIDPASGAVELARKFATADGLSKATFEVAAAEAIPFPDASFDCLTCRFGAMYFSDLRAAVVEAHRVLGPGGRLGWLAWGPIEQPFWEATARVALRHAGMREYPPEALQPMCFGGGGRLAAALAAGGFEEVRETPHEVLWSWPGPPEEVAAMWFAGAPPFRSILAALDERAGAAALSEMTQRLAAYADSGRVTVPERVVLATARRGA
ncbi:MAG TPA: methyltransferase domain-containing protein [Thermoplasmata archaeon]|nr:methyltransferase domain-containing protein [Thermoplasmata archaeon]